VAIEDTVAIPLLQQQTPDLSDGLFQKLQHHAQRWSVFPNVEELFPELHQIAVDFLRELVIAPYRLLYRIDHQTVHSLAVFHGRRNQEDLLLERALRAI
jgi:plasmid stabilization system protein ParE